MPEETKNAIVSDVDNTTLLHQALIKENYSQVEELLLTRKIDIDSKNAFGIRSLYMAALKNQFKIAKILLDQGADPNATSKGSTALNMAAAQGNIEMLKLLLDRGAVVANDNCTLLHAAVESIKAQELESKVFI